MEVSWLFTTLLCGSFLLFTVANLLFSILGNHLAREATLSDSFDATVDEMSRSASETAQQVFDGYIIASRYVGSELCSSREATECVCSGSLGCQLLWRVHLLDIFNCQFTKWVSCLEIANEACQ